jgi:hypothetical protein
MYDPKSEYWIQHVGFENDETLLEKDRIFLDVDGTYACSKNKRLAVPGNVVASMIRILKKARPYWVHVPVLVTNEEPDHEPT